MALLGASPLHNKYVHSLYQKPHIFYKANEISANYLMDQHLTFHQSHSRTDAHKLHNSHINSLDFSCNTASDHEDQLTPEPKYYEPAKYHMPHSRQIWVSGYITIHTVERSTVLDLAARMYKPLASSSLLPAK